jgi:hypothetical protein
VPIAAPAISGDDSEGQVLNASPGTWGNSPTSIVFQWQRCTPSGTACEDLPGETGASRRLTVADVGHTVRVVVTASDPVGASSAASAPSGLVTATAGATTLATTTSRLPVVGSTLTWRFGAAKHGVRVFALTVHGLAKGASVRLECVGSGCSLQRGKRRVCRATRCSWTYLAAQAGDVNLTGRLASARLRTGGRLTVVVTKPGALGIAYEFNVHSGRRVSAQLRCRAPGSFTQPHEC